MGDEQWTECAKGLGQGLASVAFWALKLDRACFGSGHIGLVQIVDAMRAGLDANWTCERVLLELAERVYSDGVCGSPVVMDACKRHMAALQEGFGR